MKLRTNTIFERGRELDAAEAVQFVASRIAYQHEGDHARALARAEALQGVLGRLIGALIDNGRLRPEQVEAIFDYDVLAEE